MLGEAGTASVSGGARGPLLRGAATVMSLQAGGYSTRYLLQIFFARWIGPVGYGDYSYASALAQVLSTLAGLGLPTAMIRYIPDYRERGQLPLMRGMMTRSRQLTLAAAGVAGLVAVIVLQAVSPRRFESGTLMLGIWISPLLALSALESETLRALDRVALYSMPILADPLLTLMLGVALLGFRRLTGQSAMAARAAALAVIVALQWRACQRMASSGAAERCLRTNEWLRAALPLLGVTLSSVLLARADLLILGAVRGPAEVGVYAAAASTAALVPLILNAVNARGALMMSELFARRDRAGLERLVGSMTRWAFWPSCGLALILASLRAPVMRLFGSQFSQGELPLLVLIAGQLVNAGTGPVGYLMIISGNQDASLIAVGCSALVSVVGCLILVPLWGALGAAASSAAALSAWNAWLYLLAERRAGVKLKPPWVFTSPETVGARAK